MYDISLSIHIRFTLNFIDVRYTTTQIKINYSDEAFEEYQGYCDSF